jgi:hypothetical protein
VSFPPLLCPETTPDPFFFRMSWDVALVRMRGAFRPSRS